MYLSARREPQQLRLDLEGDWRIGALRPIEAELDAVEFGDARRLLIAPAGVRSLDLSGA